MCLVIISNEKPKAKIAEKDIHCYKLITFSPYISRVILKTPFICDDIELGVRNHESSPMRPSLAPEKSGKRGNWWEINGGGFYTYTNLEDAKNDAIYMQKYEAYNQKQYIVLHAVIPKGTKYYEGTCDGKSSYESKDVIYSRDVAWINRSSFSEFRYRLQNAKLRVETKGGRPNVKAMREKTIDQLNF